MKRLLTTAGLVRDTALTIQVNGRLGSGRANVAFWTRLPGASWTPGFQMGPLPISIRFWQVRYSWSRLVDLSPLGRAMPKSLRLPGFLMMLLLLCGIRLSAQDIAVRVEAIRLMERANAVSRPTHRIRNHKEEI